MEKWWPAIAGIIAGMGVSLSFEAFTTEWFGLVLMWAATCILVMSEPRK